MTVLTMCASGSTRGTLAALPLWTLEAPVALESFLCTALPFEPTSDSPRSTLIPLSENRNLPHFSVPNPPSHVSAIWGDAAASASCVRRHSTPSNKRPRLSNSSWQSTTCGKYKLHNVQNMRQIYLVERHERARLLQLHYELAYLHRSPPLENLLALHNQQGGA